MNHDVFISYSSKNPPAAQAICHELEEHGIRCWMAPRDIPMGSKYATVITQAIKTCKVVVLVFSGYSARSPWVESEINIAFSNRKPIIPYKIDTSVIENYDEFYLLLNNRHWIEAYPDYRSRFSELVSTVEATVGKRTTQVIDYDKDRYRNIFTTTITDSCVACGTCIDECPVEAISEGEIYVIDPDKCINCGTCASVCPAEAIVAGE